MTEFERGARVYVAGPMASVGGNYNFPLFDYVAERLRASNCMVCNPADVARERIGPLEVIQKLDKQQMAGMRRELLKYEINWIIDNADMVLMLPGWEKSLGATAERAVALAVGKPVREAPNIILPVDSFLKKRELTTPQKIEDDG